MIDGIASNIIIAQQQATNLKQALIPLTKEWYPDTDKLTTLQGNAKLQEISKNELASLELLCNILEKDIANINSVAKEFEALDQQLQKGFTIPKS
ncbi:TIGR04197 family type VII secretion effector [Listeria welshimeri]|uniref:TIGR04197 family type VII secretion effector n=1 Tax=Listeria welshimeri TaxID=1643 RepID=UPI0018898F32|nr:TIGR04197 family type VII secretion effector [Listeria welshimeri]MBF2356576.1 TIGR04197 family type VII secretion effector [Listeria welshimeri]MBF2380271.1 TIGR04197 family type VII secretion effector [Listeria welshimeri]MBF2677198.1 TIGR04197 family type VII secretion effector [Listeria welshimeri]